MPVEVIFATQNIFEPLFVNFMALINYVCVVIILYAISKWQRERPFIFWLDFFSELCKMEIEILVQNDKMK